MKRAPVNAQFKTAFVADPGNRRDMRNAVFCF